jgi:two-component system CheB/CheR fusion protein
VVINEKGEILYVHGRTGNYLEIISGEFSGNIFGLAREGLKPELVAATRKAVTGKQDVLLKGLRIKTDSGQQFINLVIKPIAEPQSMKGLFVVLFEDIEPEKERVSSKKKPDGTPEEPRIQELENELQSTREYLQASIEELETSNEELKSLNEELQSSNEELQSSNEELETSREELQSVNEELTTVNTELERTITELSKKSSDIANLFSSTEIGIIFLDSNLNIDRFTPAMTRFINLIPGDVGRPVSHIASNMRYENLEQDAREVLATLNMKELEVWTKKDQCYVMKIRPYRTIDNVIDGVVVTFMDITEHKRMDERLTLALRYSEGIVNTVREPMLALTSDFRVKTANRSFYRFFKTTKEQTEGKLIYDLGNREWDIPKLRELLEKILPESLEMEDFKVVHEFSSIGKRTMILNARRLETGLDFGEMILLAIEDITEKNKND